jgi:hypothetical protein
VNVQETKFLFLKIYGFGKKCNFEQELAALYPAFKIGW